MNETEQFTSQQLLERLTELALSNASAIEIILSTLRDNELISKEEFDVLYKERFEDNRANLTAGLLGLPIEDVLAKLKK